MSAKKTPSALNLTDATMSESHCLVVPQFELLSSSRTLLAQKFPCANAPFDGAQDRLPPLTKGD